MDLQYYKTFNEETSQGIVGLLRPLNPKSKKQAVLKSNKPSFLVSSTDYFFVEDEPSYPIYVFKIPKEVNTLVEHELKVSQDMEELSIYLPHFNRVYEVQRNVKCYIPEKKKLVDNFNPFDQYNCIRDVSIIEYIPSKLTLLKYVTESIFSGYTDTLIHQVVVGLFIAQQEKNFTHYDLHLENILLRRCLKRTFFWYKFMYEGVVIDRLIFTNGYFPVIFDYGFAYSKGLEGTNYTNSLFFTNKGYTPFKFDPINDFKTLMVRLAYTKGSSAKFKNFANTHFLKSNRLKIKLDRETGWIKSTISSAARIVCKRLDKIMKEMDLNHKNNFIYKELDNLVDLFGILITLPIGRNNYNTLTLKEDMRGFVEEWSKIDEWFKPTSTDDKLNIMKRILEAINDLILEDINQDEFTHNFKLKLFNILDAFGDFINIENIDYGRFISSTIQLSNFIEHICYAEMQRFNKLFNFESVLDNWSLFNSIEELVGPKTPYKFQKDDSIVLFNCVDKSTSSFELKDDEVINVLNTTSDVMVQISLLDSLPLEDC